MRRAAIALFAIVALPEVALAQRPPVDSVTTDSTRARLEPLIVRALPVGGSTLATPWAVSITERDPRDRARAGLALDDALRAMPGVQVDNRYNYALGERIAVRGFGARTQFGVRGVRVLVDGVPATLPDGQTTLNHVDVSLVRRVELLRGAASSLYGNAAGGVLLLETEQPSAAPAAVEVSALAGADGLRRSRATVSGSGGRTGWIVTGSRLTARGHRAHADAESNWLLGRLMHEWSSGSASLVVNGVDYDARNPGSLSDSLLRVDRRQAFRNNVLQNTGETGKQLQVGGSLRSLRDGVQFELAPYLVRRAIDNPIPGRVIALDRVGGGARAVVSRPESERARLWWAAGAVLDRQRDDRQNYQNASGGHGALLLDQLERVSATAAFAQLGVVPVAPLRVSGGARFDRVRFAAADRLVTATDPDDSGARTMSAFSPSIGASLTIAPRLVVYGNVAGAFETPTTTELANRPTTAGGFNPELEPQRASSAELGVKGTHGAFAFEGALFDAHVRDALIPFEVAGAPGRQFFRNAGRVRHRGVELGSRWRPTASFRTELSYTLTESRFVEYIVGGTDHAGKRLPGVSPQRLELTSTLGAMRGPFIALDLRAVGRTPADDAGSAHAGGYLSIDLRAGLVEVRSPAGELTLHAGASNLFDARYNASVVVNAFGGRFFEPAPGRSLVLGASLRVRGGGVGTGSGQSGARAGSEWGQSRAP